MQQEYYAREGTVKVTLVSSELWGEVQQRALTPVGREAIKVARVSSGFVGAVSVLSCPFRNYFWVTSDPVPTSALRQPACVAVASVVVAMVVECLPVWRCCGSFVFLL